MIHRPLDRRGAPCSCSRSALEFSKLPDAALDDLRESFYLRRGVTSRPERIANLPGRQAREKIPIHLASAYLASGVSSLLI